MHQVHLAPLTWLASVFKYVVTFGFAATLMFPPAIGDIPENKEIKQKDQLIFPFSEKWLFEKKLKHYPCTGLGAYYNLQNKHE